MDFIINLVAFVFSLGIIVAIHELGHLVFAKRAGILCFEYAIGMGPAIYKKKGKETNFAIRVIPIGGFVSMAGESMATEMIKKDMVVGLNFLNDEVRDIVLSNEVDAEKKMTITDFEIYNEHQTGLFIEGYVDQEIKRYTIREDALYKLSPKNELQIAPYDRCFESKTYTQKLLTLIAGPAMNFLLAILLFLVVVLFTGKPLNSNVLGKVSEGNPASVAGIQKGDKIVSIDGKNVDSWTSIGEALSSIESFSDVEVVLSRKGTDSLMTVTLNPRIDVNQIGISNFGTAGVLVSPGGAAVGQAYGKSEGILKENDLITKVVYKDVTYTINGWEDIYALKNILDGDTIAVTFTREGVSKTEHLHVWDKVVLKSQGAPGMQVLIGIEPTYGFDLGYTLTYPFKRTYQSFMEVVMVLRLLFGGSNQIGVGDLSGPVGIFNIVGVFARQGILSLLSFVAFLSVNIGFINLLPIPALDGGRILFISIEKVTKKRIPRKTENLVNNIFFILLMILFVYITFNDVLRLF